MEAKQELELRRRLESSSSPREELEIRRQLSSSQSPTQEPTEDKEPGFLKQVKGLTGKSYLFNPALAPFKALGDVIDTVKKIKEDPQKNIPEMLLASPPVRFAGNVAGSAMSGLQLAENTIREMAPNVSRKVEDFNRSIGLPGTMNEVIDRYEGNTRQARAAQGDVGFDPVALAGRVMDPAALKVSKLLPLVRGEGLMGLGKNMLRSGITGAVSAGTTPVEQGETDYFPRLLSRTAIGGAVGAAIPPITGAIGGTVNFLKDMYGAVSPSGAKPLAVDALVNRIGKENVPDVVKGLRVDARKLPGDRPSAGDLMVGVPAGSPIISQQKASFAAEGGASRIAGDYRVAQQKVVKEARESLNKTMIPAKEKIFERVDKVGIKTDKLLSGIDDVLKHPDTVGAGSLAVSKVKRMIEKKATEGSLAASTLHKIRREGINEIIESFVKPGVKSSRKEASSALKKVREVIDNVIEGSGGGGWKTWLKKYEESAKKISEVEGRIKLKPIQPTSVSGDIARKESTEFANVLYRPATIANWLHKWGVKQGGGLSVRIHKELARGFIKPQQLADDLERAIAGKPSPILDRMGIPASVIVTNIMKKNKESQDGN